MAGPVDPRRGLGVAGEDAAAAWYTARGYTVLDRNWRCRDGELDLVLGRPGLVVFCEVKTRSGVMFGAPVEAVTARKQQRLRVLAAQWLRSRGSELGIAAATLRFDVAAVMRGRAGPPTIDVIEAAF